MLHPLLISPSLCSEAKDRQQLKRKVRSPEVQAAHGPHPSLIPPNSPPQHQAGFGHSQASPTPGRGRSGPHTALTLAPSLPGAPLAPRGPAGPGGPCTPRSPGKPLSPWEGKDRARDGSSRARARARGGASWWKQKRLYLLLLQRGRGHRDLQEHPEGERGAKSEDLGPPH